MALQPGTRIGGCEIISGIGAGGMGEVYRARDLKLNRDVAVKVLPNLFAADPDRLSRFQREAQVLASLNHPHVAQVYGVVDDPPALLMELVDGEDLAARLARGPLPLPEALEIGRQVADALESAHAQGIVHRDLKPANIKIRTDGTVKVLDFGLAKAAAASPAGSGVEAHSPTITSPAAMTAMGLILGTAAYMSPEQAKGRPVDRATDLWAFGAVLFEVLTGRPAFDGETVTDVLAAIVTRDPDWTALPSSTPAGIVRLLRRCLERDRRRRLADAGEVRFQLEEALADRGDQETKSAQARPPSLVRRAAPWVIAAALAAGAVSYAAFLIAPRPQVARYAIEMPSGALVPLTLRPSVAVSPDGESVVFVATVKGTDRLFHRRRNDFDSQPIDGTDGASGPVISPDGRWIAFFAGSKLMKIPLTGGPATMLAEAPDARGLSWDLPESIVFTPLSTGGVFRVSPDGGVPTQVTTLRPEAERTHRWPQELPDGTVIYTVGTFSSPDAYDDAVIEAWRPGGDRRVLLNGAAMARVLANRYLVFLRGDDLFAVPFDPAGLQTTGTPVPVLRRVGSDPTTGAAHFAVGRDGTLVLASAASSVTSTVLMWVDAGGRPERLPLPPGGYTDPAISPDGQNVALSVVGRGHRDIWVYNVKRQTFTRLTFGASGEGSVSPVWSSDGTWIYYSLISPEGTTSVVHRRRADGSGDAEPLVKVPERAYLDFLFPGDRRAMLDALTMGRTMSDLLMIDLRRDAAPEPFLATAFDEFGAQLSPDGKWIAYTSRESGRYEVYVRRADGAGGRWQVSNVGAEEPKWAPDGRQLFFRAGTELLAVNVDARAAFTTSTPARVLTGMFNLRNDTGLTYAIDPVTRRFLTIRPVEDGVSDPVLRVVLNWTRELADLVR